MNELNENILEEIEEKNNITKVENKFFKNKKIIFSSFLCCSLLIGGLIFINIKCGSFSNNISPCDFPNYCPNKEICDGSN